MESRSLKRVALIGSYLPRPCGIATFSNDVFKSLKAARPDWELSVLAVNDPQHDYEYPDEVRFVIEPTTEGYARAAAFLKASQFDAIFLQHEFGLFGGLAGDRIFSLLDRVRTPLVTMFHTILDKPDEHQFRVTRQLAARSSHLITMSPRGEQFLSDVYQVDRERISVLPHGIPDVAFIDPIFYKEELGLLGRKVALTFGLLSPGKGIEYAIESLPHVVEKHPDLVYVILGATHPHLLQQEGERYRESLQAKVDELGLHDHVRFVNQFVELEDLTHYLCASDVYLTPYLNQAQITSGTLAYAYGCGNAVISTPYWYAEDMLADGRGRLVDFRNAEAIAEAMNELLDDEITRSKMRKSAYLEGRQMTWPVVSQQMAEILESAHNRMFTHVDPRGRPEKSLTKRTSVSADELQVVDRLLLAINEDADQLTQSLSDVVQIKLDHLVALSDDVGLVQHASYQIANWHEGYCTDDNTRGILLTLALDRLGFRHPQLAKLSRTYRAFLNYAIEPTSHAVRNFMGFDRRWLEDHGSDDCLGRVVWTLGACVDTADDLDTESWATGLFDSILSQTLTCSSPRAWSFGILGAAHYQNHFAGECRSREAIREFSS
ncbi:MAG: glycosyltransferase family 4 protein, partial [Novipirellula sp. JB048]